MNYSRWTQKGLSGVRGGLKIAGLAWQYTQLNRPYLDGNVTV
jgi:hypothetical protein